MSQALNHILDKSACLSKVQLAGYAAGTLIEEEVYAVETHLNSCALCSAAGDGVLLHQPESIAALAELDSSFLKKYFEENKPQIHLNSVAPAVTLRQRKRKDVAYQFPVRTIARLTAAGLAVLGIFWLLNKIGTTDPEVMTPAQLSPVEREESQPLPKQPGMTLPATPAIDKAMTTIPAAIPAVKAIEAVLPEEKVETSQVQNEASLPDPQTPGEETKGTVALPVVIEPEIPAAPKNEMKPVALPPSPEKAAPEPLGSSKVTEQQQFHHTIQTYKKDLNDPDREKRNLARLVSASAYQGLGEDEKAAQLLEQILDEGGPHKAEARRALRKLRRQQ